MHSEIWKFDYLIFDYSKINVNDLFKCQSKFGLFYSEHNEKNVYSNVLEVIGDTPLIKLNKIPKEAGLKCDVCEFSEHFRVCPTLLI